MNKLSNLSKIASISAIIIGIVTSSSAMAETTWQANHPRRTEVNHRLANQNKRIDRKVADGQMSAAQGAAAHKDDHQIRQEERDMASQDGGHITKTEDKALNQQENANSAAIHNE